MVSPARGCPAFRVSCGYLVSLLFIILDFRDAMRLVPLFILCCILISCSNADRRDKTQPDKTPVPSSSEKESLPVSTLPGKDLAKAYCSTCHAYVDPELLPKSVWEEDVLPAMGHRLGMYAGGKRPESLFDAGVSGSIVRRANIYPERPVMAEEDWKKIKEYMIASAPDTLPPPVRERKIRMDLKHFKYRETSFSQRPAMTTMVKILPAKRGVVYSDGKGRRNTLTFLTADLQENYSLPLQLTPVQFYEKANEVYLTTIGRGVFPNDAPDGTLQLLKRNWPQPKYEQSDVVLKNLQRPVCLAYGDLNKDDLQDIVACEFGDKTGRLSWYQNDGKNGYQKKILRDKPGAITAIIRDANKDGLPDIYVLMAQGDEGIFLYENLGSGKFQERRLLSFSPLYGSQYIELADFNKDGFDDIVYVCGDNADMTPILKRYHGIYIFLNDGKSNFKEAFFYQMNGAYKAMARDYDLDGDLDIAAISLFPDYARSPEESFIYLRNRGNLKFDDHSFAESSRGRWMVMDAEDMDADGDIDLALGSSVYFKPEGDTTGLGKRWLVSSPSVIVLENTIR